MNAGRAHRLSALLLLLLSAAALLPILLAVLRIAVSGQVPPPERDEGTGAHVFQLSVAAFFPALALYAATADWTRPAPVFRRLAVPMAGLALAFGLLFLFEHVLVR